MRTSIRGVHLLSRVNLSYLHLKRASGKEVKGWITETSLTQLLTGKPISGQESIKPEKVSLTESHVGLGIDYRRRAADEKNRLLYRAEFSRAYATSEVMEQQKSANRKNKTTEQQGSTPIEDYEIGLLLEANDGLLDSGYLSLGGESRFAAYQQVAYDNKLTIPNNHKGRIKVVLLTPAYFSGGWQATNGDWSRWMGSDAKLVSIAAGSPMVISGWDMVLGQPKPLYRYMPAGSVYYFEDATPTGLPFTESPTPSASLENNTPLNAGQMGFGSVAYGTWDYLNESI